MFSAKERELRSKKPGEIASESKTLEEMALELQKSEERASKSKTPEEMASKSETTEEIASDYETFEGTASNFKKPKETASTSTKSTSDSNSHESKLKKIIIIGKSGNGKSSLGNSLLGKIKFEAKKGLNATTENCSLEKVESIQVVDTPGLCDTGKSVVERALDIQFALKICPNPHAFLIVFNADARMTDEELCTIDILRIVFGDEYFDHAIVVFTHVEPDEDYYYKKNKEMMEIVNRCGERVAFIDNKHKNNADQVNAILKKVEQVSNNGKKTYQSKYSSAHEEFLNNHLKKQKEFQKSLQKEYEDMKKRLKKYEDGVNMHEEIKALAEEVTKLRNDLEYKNKLIKSTIKGVGVSGATYIGAPYAAAAASHPAVQAKLATFAGSTIGQTVVPAATFVAQKVSLIKKII